MKSTTAIRRPILSRHARYRWDALRQKHQIVFPEGVLVLNESGAAIVKLCDGQPIAELVAALEQQFPDSQLETEIHAFLERLFEKGLLSDSPGGANP